jgi:Serine dehydrogenase proteinase
VSTDLPNEVRLLMRLYPQPRGRRPSVEYIPLPYGNPDRMPGSSDRPRQDGGRARLVGRRQGPGRQVHMRSSHAA